MSCVLDALGPRVVPPTLGEPLGPPIGGPLSSPPSRYRSSPLGSPTAARTVRSDPPGEATKNPRGIVNCRIYNLQSPRARPRAAPRAAGARPPGRATPAGPPWRRGVLTENEFSSFRSSTPWRRGVLTENEFSMLSRHSAVWLGAHPLICVLTQRCVIELRAPVFGLGTQTRQSGKRVAYSGSCRARSKRGNRPALFSP